MMVTDIPRARSASAVANPIPLLPPVTIACAEGSVFTLSDAKRARIWLGSPGFHQRGKLIERHRPAEIISLPDIAAHIAQRRNIGCTWKLLSNVRQAVGTDKVVDNLGAHPNGVLIVTPEHRFIVVFTAEGRKPAKTTEEFSALQKANWPIRG
jgi:hypothetical protein